MHRLSLFVVGVALTTVNCGDSTGPRNPGVFSFAGTLDGIPWSADTAVALVSGAPGDTTLNLTAVRRVSPTEEQQMTVVLRGFGLHGQFALADTAGVGLGAFSISRISGGVVTSTLVYLSTVQNPGTLSITSINRTDSTVAGSFVFDAATSPDTTTHRAVTGQFRLRFGFQEVFPPVPPRMPPNRGMELAKRGRPLS